jgi:SAM-dependent methyltransferase
MQPPGGRRGQYTPRDAQLYAALGIRGTTYEIGFTALAAELADLAGRTVLDFGCGAGRSSAFLVGLGAPRVFAVDHSAEMLAELARRGIPEVTGVLSGEAIPLPSASVDLAVSANAFIEIHRRPTLVATCREIQRVLRPGGRFVILTGGPDAFGCRFRSFSYPSAQTSAADGTITCVIHSPRGDVEIRDMLWAESDYRDALGEAGFRVLRSGSPRGAPADYPDTDEPGTAPFLLLVAERGDPRVLPASAG